MPRSRTRDGELTGTLLPAKYDLLVTDADDKTIGLVVDWKQGGYSWVIERPSIPTNNSAPTVDSGESYDIRDANDYYRIIFTDWVKGVGQESRDEIGADAALSWDSRSIDVSRKGYLRLGPQSIAYASNPGNIDGPVYAALKTQGGAAGIPDGLPAVFAAFTPAGSDPRASIRYSVDCVTWQAVDFSGPDPTGSVTCFCDDGQYCYAAFSGTDGVWRGKADDADNAWASWGAGADADGIVAMAYCNGVLYAAKGGATEAAQIGSFAMDTGVWTKLSPHYVSHGSVTAGLVAVGPYVYWTITNGVRSTVYKCSTHTTTDTFEQYAEFPTGFIALCSVGYGGVVYVGGYYDGPNLDKGMGAIYACTDAGPALVANMGDGSEDWRVYAMATYEKNLYYLSNGSVWRYDLVNGGYSHWYGPFTESGATTGVPWDEVEATMATEPGPPDWSVTSTGSPSRSVAGGILTVSGVGDGDSIVYVRNDPSISPAGTTLEVAFPAAAMQGAYGYFYIDDGTDKLLAVISSSAGRDRTYGPGDPVNLRLANSSGGATIIGAGWKYGDAATVRLTLQNGVGRVYLNDQHVKTTSDLPAGATKSIAFGASGTVVTPHQTWDYRLKVDNVKYSHAGAYDPGVGVTGNSLMTAVRDAVWVGTRDVEIRKQVVAPTENNGLVYATRGWLKSSRSTARMSTIPKYISAVDVFIADQLEDGETVAVQTVVDGISEASTPLTALSTETLLSFAVDRVGTDVAVILTLTGPGTSTPEVKHVAVKFTPMSASNVLHTFTCNLRDHVQSGIRGHKYDEDPDTVIGTIIGWGSKVLTVEYAGVSFKAKLEAVEAKGYPQSRRQTAENQGTVRLTMREMA